MADDRLQLIPWDTHNQTLLAHVHPSDWVNPEPEPIYNLVVIGAGTAGLVTAAGAAGLGAKVALIEKHLMGGDCLNVGCVPSKAIIASSRLVGDFRHASDFGIGVPRDPEIDFAAVMGRMREIRAGISHHDSARRFQNLGVDVFLGAGSFVGGNMIAVAGKQLRFKKAVIATGARAAIPEIPGLVEAGYLTNETVFSLTERPRRFAVIGGGPIGCELAQAFDRLGSEVILFHKNAHLLDREDADAAAIVQQQFMDEGIQLVLNAKLQRVETTEAGKTLSYESNGQTQAIAVDEILVATGRQPNVESLNLEAVGVNYDRRQGVEVNDYLQTSNPNIYAAGDVCMKWKFTHAADAAARIVIKNSLFSVFGLGKSRLSDLTMPWSTYTDPEIAHVGLYEQEARAKGIDLDTFMVPMSSVDRAIADGETQGFVKIHVNKGTDKMVGATVVARHAGDLISEITVAMVNGIGLGAIANVIHPYPTQAEAIKKAADAYNRTRLTPFVKTLFERWLAWQRG
ncbi:mercuric reductase [Oxynema sp. CENA135]|uniref:mercuric reductase n=1 Tax=Oxynema sp. CENA135 TaxID=984206 RepID=UPI00190B9E39|nr:mercuric reductase [Oxynema sp. CENA135]MBK4728800.1 mercuric reductase [Oxynema sp. CENA135]